MSNARKLGNMTTHGLDGDFNVDPTDNTLVVDSTNNRVGIGSATPTTTLDITGTATATAFSGPLTGNVTGTTSSISNHDTDALSEGSTNLYYTNARADARAQLKIDALVDSAPGTLDTLNELAAALGDDANFSTTITNSIADKLPLSGGTITGNLEINTGTNKNIDITALSHQTVSNMGVGLTFSRTTSDAPLMSVGVIESDKLSLMSRSGIKFLVGGTNNYQYTSEAMTINGSGNVGIGTDSPNQLLEIQDSTPGLRIHANDLNTAPNPKIELMRGTSNTFGGDAYTDWRLEVQNDARFRITSHDNTYGENVRFIIKHDTGNTGIGTANPAEKFHIASSSGNTIMNLQRTNTNTTGTVGAIAFTASDGHVVAAVNALGDGNDDGADLQFRTTSAASGPNYYNDTDPRMTIKGSGLIGIGTDSPQTILHINSSNPEIRLQPAADTETSRIRFRNAADDSSRGQISYDHTNQKMVFNVTGDRMWITNSGNVGIGTTNPAYKLDVFNNTTDTGSQLRVKNAHTAVGADAVVNIDGYGASTLKLWRNGIEEWKLERITSSDNLGLYAYGGAVSGGAGAGLIQFWDYDTGGIGFGTDSPGARLEIYDSHGGNTGHSSYGHPVSGGSNGALYINKANSRIDWDDGLVFCGEGTTWSARFTGRNGLITNSDTNGEILGVHPVEGSATGSWNDTAGANSVTSAFLRVMGNGKTFVKKLNSEDAFRAPTHATDAAANSAGGNVAGSIYYNTFTNVHRAYNGTQWTSVGSAPITESVFDAFRDGSALCLLKGNNSNGDTGGNHNGSLQGGATYTTTTKFGSHAFDLVGAGVYLDIPTLPMIETVSFWFYCVGGNPGYLVDFRHDNPNNGRSYLYTHAGAVGGTGQHVDMGDDTTTTNRTGVIYINGAQYTSGQYNFLAGNWYHIVLVRNSTDTHRTWDQGIRFGNRSDGTTHGSAGHFDQIRIFNSRISASQALDLYNETG